jgi:perosamine synthetase
MRTAEAVLYYWSIDGHMGEDDQIPLFEIDWAQEDLDYVTESITRGGYWADGPFVSEFESRIAAYLGVEEAVVVNSGTSALVCALEAHGIGPGDEVIVPSFTFIATANAVELVGAQPVFADIERDTYGLDPEAVQDQVTPDTAAVIPVHLYGGACRIGELTTVAEEYDIAVIEDAAEAMGARTDEGMLGTIGDAGVLSFCQNKIISTGEGGAVVTDDPAVAARARRFRSHGRAAEDYFYSGESGQYVDVGGNLRLSDLSAGLGCAQIERIEELVGGRRRAADAYTEQFEQVPHAEPDTVDVGRHVYQLYTVTFDECVDRATVVATLEEHGISAKPYWDTPVHLTTRYREAYGYEPGHLPVTEDVAERVLSLPIHPNITTEEIDRVVTAVRAGVERSLSESEQTGRLK